MTGQSKKWFEIRADLKAEIVEAVEDVFNAAGACGSSVDLVPIRGSRIRSVAGYFDEEPNIALLQKSIAKTLADRGIAPGCEVILRKATIADRDWLEEWKRHWKPVKTGRFIVAPSWFELPAGEDVVVLIDPGMAFGTGTHETTQLCLHAIEMYFGCGMSFLDVGTGTGVLAIAAAKLTAGTGKFLAIDNDPEALGIAKENANINGLNSLICFDHGSVDDVLECFDVICANLTADVIIPLIPRLVELTNERLILSGVLTEQEEMIRNAIPTGLNLAIESKGEWLAFHLTKEPARGGKPMIDQEFS